MSQSNESLPRQKGKRQRTSSTPTSVSEPSASRGVSGWVEFPLESVKEHFTCSLCKGYLRCAHTISECLHSFCKSCLFRAYSRGLTKCPSCHVNLGPDPSSVTIFDRTLQEVIDKLLPELNETDIIEEMKYYQKKGISPKKEFAEEIDREEQRILEKTVDGGTGDENKPSALMSEGGTKVQSSPGHQRPMLRRQIYELSCDELNVELIMEDCGESGELSGTEKDNTIPLLKNPCIRTSGKLKICQLKKYILSQLKLAPKYLSKLIVTCKGDPVEDDFSLAFLQKTRWDDLPDKDMILNFYFKPSLKSSERSG